MKKYTRRNYRDVSEEKIISYLNNGWTVESISKALNASPKRIKELRKRYKIYRLGKYYDGLMGER